MNGLRRLVWGGAFVSATFATSAHAQLTIRVTSVPAGTPTAAVIHAAGSFNGWNPAAPGSALARQADGTYALTLPRDVRGPVELKLTLGSWETVETTASGGDVANRAVTAPAAGADTVMMSVAAWRDPSARPVTKTSTRSPSVHVLNDSFAMPQLGRTRRVWVYLPPGYASSKGRYPVLYMHDGQNVFDAATAFAGEWGVDESLDSLHALGDRGVIVVAVDHGDSHRLDEYDPWKNADPKYGGGEGDAYVDFLVRTLKPYVDAHYRTRPDRSSTAIMGSSMGGLISLYAALVRPDVFGRAGVFSCACWIADPRIFTLAAHRPTGPRPRIYFVAGGAETADGSQARDQGRVVQALVAAGYRVGTSVRALTVPAGTHSEGFWRREFPTAYRWLFR